MFAKPHPKYEYANLQVAYQEKNILTFNHLMILMYCFARRTEKNLQKQQKVLPVSSNLFQPLSQVLLSQHPLLLTILLFGIVSNLNLHVNKFFKNNCQTTEKIKQLTTIIYRHQHKVPQHHRFLFVKVLAFSCCLWHW